MDLEEIKKRIERMEKLRIEFKKELLELFKKYGATLSYDSFYDSCSGACISNEIEITAKEGKEEFYLLVVHGSKIGIEDLEGE